MSDRIGGDGGAICISASGEIGIEWNSDKMSWATLQVGQEEDQPIQVNYGCLRGKTLQQISNQISIPFSEQGSFLHNLTFA